VKNVNEDMKDWLLETGHRTYFTLLADRFITYKKAKLALNLKTESQISVFLTYFKKLSRRSQSFPKKLE